MKKKFSFSLLEVVIVCLLTTTIVIFVLQQLRSSALLKNELKMIESRALFQDRMVNKLTQYFHHMRPTSGNIYTLSEHGSYSLIFKFDHGIDPKQELCHEVMGKLFLENNQVFISIFSKKDNLNSPENQLIDCVAKDVEKLSFSFLKYEEKMHTFKKVDKWGEAEAAIPEVVQLHLKYKNTKEVVTHTFYMPTHHQIIHGS